MPFWWERFMQDSAYKSNLRCRWKQLRQTSLSNQHINFLIDSINTLLGEAQQRHFQKWPILGQYVWPNPNPIPTTYAEEISTLKQWLTSRIGWMDTNIPNTGACADWPADVNGTMIIKVFPSPFKNNLQVQVQSKKTQTIKLQISNAIGQVVYSKQISAVVGINSLSDFSLVKWAAGVYNFYFTTEDGEKVLERVVRQ